MPTAAARSPWTRILLGPGPSNVHPRVLQALARPVIGDLLDVVPHVQTPSVCHALCRSCLYPVLGQLAAQPTRALALIGMASAKCMALQRLHETSGHGKMCPHVEK